MRSSPIILTNSRSSTVLTDRDTFLPCAPGRSVTSGLSRMMSMSEPASASLRPSGSEQDHVAGLCYYQDTPNNFLQGLLVNHASTSTHHCPLQKNTSQSQLGMRSGSNSTRISTSLSGLKSSRNAEPKTASRRMPCFWQNAATYSGESWKFFMAQAPYDLGHDQAPSRL